jgi:hypothetical protein
MTGALLTRIRFVAIAAVLFSAASVVTVRADPVSVTSGVFVLPDDDASFFQFFGADGFVLGGLFIPTPISPHGTCVRGGCTPGTNVDMSAVAGGDLARGSLGLSTAAIVNGTEFQSLPFRLRLDSLQLRGVFRFDAPVTRLSDSSATAPFNFNGQVTAFAREDLDLIAPLFSVDLMGHGTVQLTGFPEPVDVAAIYTFTTDAPAVPEPATFALFASGLAGMACAWRRKRRRVEPASGIAGSTR